MKNKYPKIKYLLSRFGIVKMEIFDGRPNIKTDIEKLPEIPQSNKSFATIHEKYLKKTPQNDPQRKQKRP